MTQTDASGSAAPLELFFGDANDAEARVYARLPSAGPLDSCEISGRLIGPVCRFAKTLPATIRFINRGPGVGLLAEAVIPDPCFWTPELPFLYRCVIEVHGVAEVEAASRRSNERGETPRLHSITFERWFGIRRLGTIGPSLYLDRKRWVARGVCRARATMEDLVAAREASAVLHLPTPDDSFCLEASHLGVPLFVDVSGDEMHIMEEIRRLGQWPAIFAIVLDPALPISTEIRAAARNVLFAARIENATTTALPGWAQLAIYDLRPTENLSPAIRDLKIPIVAARQSRETLAISAARAACDRLQFDLAPTGDFAGYLV